MLCIIQLAHTVGECIHRRGGSDALFPLTLWRTCYITLDRSQITASDMHPFISSQLPVSFHQHGLVVIF